MMWTKETQAMWEAWVAERPPAVAEAVTRLVPHPENGLCIRQSDEPQAHYWIEAWSEHTDGTVTVRVTHLADSFLPGVGVFDMPTDNLVACGCGKAEFASLAQIADTDLRLDIKKAQAMAAAAAAGVDWDTITPEERRRFLFGDR